MIGVQGGSLPELSIGVVSDERAAPMWVRARQSPIDHPPKSNSFLCRAGRVIVPRAACARLACSFSR